MTQTLAILLYETKEAGRLLLEGCDYENVRELLSRYNLVGLDKTEVVSRRKLSVSKNGPKEIYTEGRLLFFKHQITSQRFFAFLSKKSRVEIKFCFYAQQVINVECTNPASLQKNNVFQIVYQNESINVGIEIGIEYLCANSREDKWKYLNQIRSFCRESVDVPWSEKYHPGLWREDSKVPFYNCCDNANKKSTGCTVSNNFTEYIKPQAQAKKGHFGFQAFENGRNYNRKAEQQERRYKTEHTDSNEVLPTNAARFDGTPFDADDDIYDDFDGYCKINDEYEQGCNSNITDKIYFEVPVRAPAIPPREAGRFTGTNLKVNNVTAPLHKKEDEIAPKNKEVRIFTSQSAGNLFERGSIDSDTIPKYLPTIPARSPPAILPKASLTKPALSPTSITDRRERSEATKPTHIEKVLSDSCTTSASTSAILQKSSNSGNNKMMQSDLKRSAFMDSETGNQKEHQRIIRTHSDLHIGIEFDSQLLRNTIARSRVAKDDVDSNSEGGYQDLIGFHSESLAMNQPIDSKVLNTRISVQEGYYSYATCMSVEMSGSHGKAFQSNESLNTPAERHISQTFARSASERDEFPSQSDTYETRSCKLKSVESAEETSTEPFSHQSNTIPGMRNINVQTIDGLHIKEHGDALRTDHQSRSHKEFQDKAKIEGCSCRQCQQCAHIDKNRPTGIGDYMIAHPSHPQFRENVVHYVNMDKGSYPRFGDYMSAYPPNQQFGGNFMSYDIDKSSHLGVDDYVLVYPSHQQFGGNFMHCGPRPLMKMPDFAYPPMFSPRPQPYYHHPQPRQQFLENKGHQCSCRGASQTCKPPPPPPDQ